MSVKKTILITNVSMINAFGGEERFTDNLVRNLSKMYNVVYVGNLYKEDGSFVSKYKKAIPAFRSDWLVNLPRLIKRRPFVKLLRAFPSIKRLFVTRLNLHVDLVISNSAIDDIALLDQPLFRYGGIIIIPHSPGIRFDGVYPRLLINNHKFRIVALNKTMSRKFFKKYGAKNVKLINPTVQEKTHDNGGANSIENADFIKRRILIVSIGRLEEKQKKLSLAIKAFSKLDRKMDAAFIIAGAGKDHNRYVRLIRRLNLQNSIKLIGKISEKEKNFLFKMALIYLQPSAKENFSVAMVEAMQAGAIPIVTRTDSSKDLIKNGRNGFFIEPNPESIAHKITQISKMSVQKIRSLRKNSRNSVKQLTPKNMIKKYIRLIESF